MKKVIIVSSTPRVNGNSYILAKHFYEGALSNNNIVEFININDLNLKFCTGCLSCQKTYKCVLKDELNDLYDKFQKSDIIVFSTPIYYYTISGQLKTFLDRLNPLYSRKNNFKEIYLLTTAADEEKSAMDIAIREIQGWIDCFDNVKLIEVIKAVGTAQIGDINNTDFLKEAYEMGKKIS